MNYKCKECGKKCFELINEVIKNFSIAYQICNSDVNKFLLLLRKGVYPYEYRERWERFKETSLPGKYVFYSKLN